MHKDSNHNRSKTFIDPIKWCRYIVNTGYITVALIILAHVIWYFAARNVLIHAPDIYLRDYIIFPAIGLFVLVLSVDLLVRISRFSLFLKEYLSLSLFIIFSLYLCLTHNIAIVLLGSFILPIFVSTVFSNVKITNGMLWTSCLAALLFGVKMYFTGQLDSSTLMQLFVACFMFVCSYLLARVLIRYGHDNLAALTSYDSRQQYMQEQLKLDLFTGIYNRKTFNEYLPTLMDECRSANECLTLAMIDIDHFKLVNDLTGHAAGDRVLLQFSRILADIEDQNIRAFRMGGDEFAVLFKDFDAEEAYRICDDMRTEMGAFRLRDTDKTCITFSCGLVCMGPKQTSLEVFTAAADSALYTAKNNGRNQVVIYDASIQYIHPSQDNAGST